MIYKYLCIVQARMSSSRLPGKVMMDINGTPAIERLFNQISNSKFIDKLILATSVDKSDNILQKWAESKNIDFFRGKLNDALDRFYCVSKIYKSRNIVRVTGDCPFVDPEIVDEIIRLFENNEYDYCSNVDPPTFPDGMDVEVFKDSVLKFIWENAKLVSEREHVTLYIRNNRNKFYTGCFKNHEDLSYIRLTLDYKEDYELLLKINSLLDKRKAYHTLKDVLDVFEKYPGLININKHIKRNEGLLNSLRKES